MEKETIRALLIFAAGVLAFCGQLIPIIVRLWDYAGASLVPYLPTIILTFFLMVALAWAVTATIWERPRTGKLLLQVYLGLIALEFSVRPWPLSRWEIAIFVVAAASAVIAIAAVSLTITLTFLIASFPKQSIEPPPSAGGE